MRLFPQVVHTYRTSCKTVTQPPGFGDFLRGTIALFELTRKYYFDLQVDFSNHPLSRYIIQFDEVSNKAEQEVYEFFNADIKRLEPFLGSLNKNDIRHVTTHAVPVNSPDSECLDFVRKRVSPTTEVELHLQALLSELGLNKYCVVHLRMGDHTFETDISTVPVVEACLRELIVPEWGQNIVLMSDNSSIKRFLANAFEAKYIPNFPVHLGQCGDKALPKNGVLDALLDFYLMSRSDKIYQYSVYPWGSSFSEMCSRIYEVPLVRIIPVSD